MGAPQADRAQMSVAIGERQTVRLLIDEAPGPVADLSIGIPVILENSQDIQVFCTGEGYPVLLPVG